MKKLYTSIIILIFSSCLLGQGNFPQWDIDYANGGIENDYLMDLYQDDEDFSIISAGHTFTSSNQDVSSANKGNSDVWIVKVDTADNIVYENSFGGDSTDVLAVLVPSGDKGFLLAGSSASGRNGDKSNGSKGGFDFWIIKVDQNGNKQWDRTIGGPGDDILTCAIGDGNGGYYLGGYSNSNAGGDKSANAYGDDDYWFVSVSSSGNVRWDATYGGDSIDVLKSIELGPNNTIVLGGYSASDASGVKSLNSYGGYDYWMLNIDDNGIISNDVTYGGQQDDFLEEIRKQIFGNGYWVSGTTYSGSSGSKSSTAFNNGDFWLLKTDSALNVSLDRTFGSNNPERNKDMEISPDGAVILAGYSSGGGGNKASGSNGGQDFWIFKVDTVGDIFWDENYGGTEEDSLEAIYIKCDRGILAGGYSNSGISGDRTHENMGDNDYWYFELSIPTHPWFRVQDVCAGVPLYFYDLSDVWPDTWEWDFDDPTSANNSSTDQHPIHTYTQAGLYNVRMTIKEGCQNDTSVTREVEVFDNTVRGKVDLGRDFTICGEDSVLLENKEQTPLRITYAWSTGDSTETIYVDTMGWYFLTISDANCTETDSVELDTCPIIHIPNAFTPNGDDMNEIFKVEGIGIREFEMFIFNRWGELIYKSTDPLEGWDGTYNGKKAQIDVYVYKVIYRGLGTVQGIEVGRVSLLR